MNRYQEENNHNIYIDFLFYENDISRKTLGYGFVVWGV